MDTYLQLAISFAAIALSAYLAEKTRSFFAPFYILAGAVLGPHALGLVQHNEVISVLGEIGVVFLLFFLGFEFSLHSLINQKKQMMIAGTVDLLVNFSLGFAFGILMGLGTFHSMVVGVAIYMSSSGIVTKSLIEIDIGKNPEGRLIMGIMVFEDIAMILFLVLISSGITANGAVNLLSIASGLGKAVVFCGLLVAVSRLCSKYIDRILDIKRNELLLLVFFSVIMLVTALGKKLGVSEALAAFFLGIALSSGSNSKRVENMTVTFRDLFGSMFFFAFGMVLNFAKILELGYIIIPGVLIAIAGKLLSSMLISKLVGCKRNMSLFIGFITLPRGEFSILVSRIASKSLAFAEPFTIVMVLVTTLTSMLVLKISRTLCKVYNICIVYPRSRLDNWGEVD